MTPGSSDSGTRRAHLRRLLSPKSLAFIGGHTMAAAVKRTLESGFRGDVWLVNPKHAEIDGVPCVASIAALPSAPDATFVGLNAKLTVQTVAELSARGAGGAVCYASGFSEAGAAGKALQQQMVASAGDMALLGPNCYGLLNYLDGAVLWPVAHGGGRVDRGVAILTQSGNFAYNVSMCDRTLPIAYMASVGNQAQTDIAELMDALLDDERVTAIGIHLEGLRNTPAFARAAYKALQKGVPIVVLKVGVSQLGSQLALSHTSSLAGSDTLYSALFDRLGIVRVDEPVAFLETLRVFGSGQKPSSPDIVAVACSGGDAELIADLAERNGLHLRPLSDAQKKSTGALLPEYAHAANPVDLTTTLWGDQPALEQLYETLYGGAGNDAAMLLVLDYPAESTGERPQCDLILDVFCRALQRHGRVGFVASVFPELMVPHARQHLRESGAVGLMGLADAMGAWGRAVRYGRRREELLRDGEAALPLLDLPAPRIQGRTLDEWDAKQMLRQFGLPLPPATTSTPAQAAADAAKLGFPVVVKVLSKDVPHKTEAGGVALGLKSPDQVSAAMVTMRERLHAFNPAVVFDRVVIERMAPAPVAEVIVGVTRSSTFGLALLIGAGGVLVEVLRDAHNLLLPTTEGAIRKTLQELRIAKILQGYRGQPAADLDALVRAIHQIAEFACANAAQLLEMDVNPLFAGTAGAVAVDALVRLEAD